MLRRTFATGLLALALLWAGPASADNITVDPDGAGSASSFELISLDWNAGNSIAIGISLDIELLLTGTPGEIDAYLDTIIGEDFQIYYQSTLSVFNTTGGAVADDTGSGNDTWSLVLGFAETLTDVFVTSGGDIILNFEFATDQSGFDNFFQIYADDSLSTTVDLDGACFVCGTVIMSGSFNSDDFTSTFSISDPSDPDNIVPLDDAGGVDDYPGVTTLSGGGTVNLTADVDPTYDTSYFLETGLNVITLAFSESGTSLPYQQVDPSTCFFASSVTLNPGRTDNPTCSGAGTFGVAPFAGVWSVGDVNGVLEGLEGRENTMFQVDALTSFTLESQEVIPEPATLTLFGLGLAGAAAARRRQQRKAKGVPAGVPAGIPTEPAK